MNQRDRSAASAGVDVSVVMAVHNAGRTVGETLACLFASPLAASREVIVVDDASTDDTAAVCGAFDVRLIRLDRNRGPARARNIGIKASRGAVIVFLDSDVTFPPDLIGRMLGLMEDRGIAGVGTFTSPDPLNAGFYPRYFAMNYYDAMLAAFDAGALNAICTRCGALRRSVYDELGGFDERYAEPSIEDYHFSLLLQGKHRIRWDRTMVHRHQYPDSFAKIWRRYWRNSRAMYLSMQDSGIRYVSPYREDLVAMALLGCAGTSAVAGLFRPSLLAAAAGLVLAAAAVKRRLIAYFIREEGMLFGLRGWTVYALLFVPVALGAMEGMAAACLARPPR